MERLESTAIAVSSKMNSFLLSQFSAIHKSKSLALVISGRLGKKKPLKKLRNKRRNYALDFRRRIAAEFAKQFNNSVVFIGLPKNIRNEHYKGSDNRKLRKRINRWAFREFAELLKLKLMENGNVAIIINE